MTDQNKANKEDKEYEKKYRKLLKEMKEEFKEFAVVQKKTSQFAHVMGKVAFWNPQLNERYTMTIGPKIYVNFTWDERPIKERYDTMIHERIHMRQFQRWGFIPYFLMYFLVPFPIKLAYLRMKWEMDAYEVNIYMALKTHGKKHVFGKEFINYILEQFCGPSYAYTWYTPERIIRWLRETVAKIERGELTWDMLTNRDRLPKTARPLRAPKILKWLYPKEFA